MRFTPAEGLKLVLAVALLVAGQVLWKIGLTEVRDFSLVQDFAGSIGRALTNAKIVGGLFIYAFSTFIYFDVLAKLPLSLVYPFMSLSYVLALIPAHFVLGEQIGPLRLVAVLIIWGGLILLVKS